MNVGGYVALRFGSVLLFSFLFFFCLKRYNGRKRVSKWEEAGKGRGERQDWMRCKELIDERYTEYILRKRGAEVN